MFLLTLKGRKDDGAYAVQDQYGEKVLFLFEEEDDAARYAMMLEYDEDYEKEMEIVEYVFLGNYVDKGFNSLETICLLMALKIKYPDHIRLLRGKHEDASVNRICGFG